MSSEKSNARLRDAFVGWQCRIREHAIRRNDGRPSSGMRPAIDGGGLDIAFHITTVLNKVDPQESITEFQYIVKKTNDPRERFEAAIKKMQAGYFQYPKTFSDRLTALFAPGSSLAEALSSKSSCDLSFEQSNQAFFLPSTVTQLDQDDPFYQATFWHNALFNPKLSGDSVVVMFEPDWNAASADPTPFA